MSFSFWLAVFILSVVIVTYLIKRFTKHETFFLVSLIRTKKPLPLFDKFSKHKKFLDFFAEAGLVLGFGSIAVDYLYGRNLPKGKRILLFLSSVIGLAVLFHGIDWFLGGFISESPLMSEYFLLIALVFGLFGFAGFVILSLIYQAQDIIVKMLVGKKACPGVAPLIPGVKIPNVPITVPMHAWISLLIILVIHEGMHGILARKENITVKSAGILLFGFLPIGAFVEPDEKELKAAPDRSQLRIFAAGPSANLAALVVIKAFILVLALLIATFVSPWASEIKQNSVSGLEITSIQEKLEICGDVYESPAYGVLESGMILKQVNDKNVSNSGQVQLLIMENKNSPLKLGLDSNGTFVEKTLSPNKIGTYGFGIKELKNSDYQVPETYKFYSSGLNFFNDFIGWLFILNLLVAIVNFLPLAIFDGGRISTIMFLPYFDFLKMSKEDTEKFIGKILFFFIIALMLVNVLPLFF